jgi:hypothetical protein
MGVLRSANSLCAKHISTWVGESHFRDATMTAPLFETYCNGAGSVCIGQALVNWRTKRSLIVHDASRHVRTDHVGRNRDFMREKESLQQLSTLYAFKEPVRPERES